MNRITALLRGLGQDRLFNLVIKNTGYLFSANMLSMILAFAQGIFAARLLGPVGIGLVGVIQTFASTINRLLSFRMGELVIRFFNKFVAEGHPERAGALVKAAALAEALTSLLAYGLLVVLAPLGARLFAGSVEGVSQPLPETIPLIIFYGLILPANLVTETATGVLQVAGRFRGQAALTLTQSLLTFVVIGAAFLLQAGIEWVLAAYLLGKLVMGVGLAAMAFRRLNGMLGAGWHRLPLSVLPDRRELFRFAFSTNISATVNLVVRDSELLWVAVFVTPVEKGLYRQALGVVNLMLLPINQLIATSAADIARLVAESAFGTLRSLLRRLTILSGGVTLAGVLGLVVLGPWVLALYGPEFVPAYPTLVVLLVGYGLANMLFWNRPLLIALGLADYTLRVSLVAMVIKVGLLLFLAPRFGILGAAAVLSIYLAATVLLYVWRGLRQVRQLEHSPVPIHEPVP